MKKYYVTLVRELTGFCIVAMAPDENTLREHLARNYGNLWCSVYKEKPPERIIGDVLYVEG
ncbi:MAG: hypothetical protein WC749_02590 [Dehalococcoidia bacterium]